MYEETEVKKAVRERYARSAAVGASCCGSGETSCARSAASQTSELGYDPADLAAVPREADLGLGCGNPLALLDLREGETVVDLGSGGGIDCFLAAKRVGPGGRVIGIDMTPEMVDRARRNALSSGCENVEFRLGEVEHLPVADATADAVISNCVINLVPDKRQVFAEAFRVLKPGGRLSVSDIVLLGDVPTRLRDSVDAYVACLAGAILRDDYLGLPSEVGFEDVRVTEARGFELEDVVAADVIAQFAQHSDVSREELAETASKFQSVRVQAIRPLGVQGA